MVNRMRMDPQGEFGRLISQVSPIRAYNQAVERALFTYKVNGVVLQQQFNALGPVQPLAWNESLESAAEKHNQVMIQQDKQDHWLPGEAWIDQRLRDAGYNPQAWGENVFGYVSDVAYGHAAFAIDWGPTSTGIQSTTPHRTNLMNPAYREAGIAFTANTNPNGTLGPNLVTQNFGNQPGSNPFLLGVAFRDLNGDGYYNAGEGLSGVKVQITGAAGTFTVDAYDTGGYQKALPPGAYTVTFTGGGLSAPVTRQVTLGTQNVKLDLVLPKNSTTPPGTGTPGGGTPGGGTPGSGQIATSQVQFSLANYRIGEGDGYATITVTLDRPQSNTAVSIDYSIGGGTATPGVDYQAVSGTLVFPAGVTSRTFTVPIYQDSIFEGDEFAYLNLSNPSNGATLGSLATAVLTIADDDPRPVAPQPVASTVVAGANRSIGAVEVSFDQALDPSTVWNAANYDLRLAGNDRAVAFRVASYDAITRTVRLVPTARLPLTTALSLKVVGTGGGGLRGANGLLIDGDRDGRDGGDYSARLARASSRVIGPILGARPRPIRPALRFMGR